MDFKSIINEEIDKDYLSIEDKIEKLANMREGFNKEIDRKYTSIMNNCKWCLYCRKFYTKRSWNVMTKKENDGVNVYSICPVGHKILKA